MATENFLEETGFSFKPGEKLGAAKLEAVNAKVNELVRTVNSDVLAAIYNVNKEIGNLGITLTLNQAVKEVPLERRVRGLQLRFIEESDGIPGWIDYIFLGEDPATEWTDLDKWFSDSFDIIDGGEW